MLKNEPGALTSVFLSLRGLLQPHAVSLTVCDDTDTKYCLTAPVGPATLQSWGGKLRRAAIPVAWVELGKAYVSYHLMGVTVPTVQSGMSEALRARMHGRTCFNFTVNDASVLSELEALTSASIAAFRRAGFVA
jgi:hypothetical protein